MTVTAGYRVGPAARRRIDDIFRHSPERWGDAEAERYLRGLFDCFADIAAGRISGRTVPVELDVAGFYCRYARHSVYWRLLADGDVGIVTVLHERMHRIERLREDDAS